LELLLLLSSRGDRGGGVILVTHSPLVIVAHNPLAVVVNIA
jgi:predicted ATPase